eukprot:TRINITY_DN414_c0_g1_i3.p1 TRINITY_DN414_c0_g1~~TRINITY_DN414_c0_g1_i3.p1  ORF type:complete len:1054 (-),score=299.78 TRINITY_DN414_c0_g1_i3:701-3862(-)
MSGTEVVVEDAAQEVVSAPVPVESAEQREVTALFQQLGAGKTADAAAVKKLVKLVKSLGVASLEDYGILEKIEVAGNDAKLPGAREGAALLVAGLIEGLGKSVEAYLVPKLALIPELYADKQMAVRKAADVAGRALMELLCPSAVKIVLPVLFEGAANRKKWQTAEGSLNLISVLAKTSPIAVAASLCDIVPNISEHMGDSKDQVRIAACNAMLDACGAVGNKDIERFVPELVSCIARPTEVPECVHKLSATTFVQAVGSPTLSIMVPLLSRGLKERATAIKRKACVIIENMSKLVDNPADAVPFLPKLLPGLDKASKEVADPECRQVAARAYAVLSSVGEEGKEVLAAYSIPSKEEEQVLLKKFEDLLGHAVLDKTTAAYVASLAAQLVGTKSFETEDWEECIVPYISPSPVSVAEAKKVSKAFLNHCFEEVERKKTGGTVVEEEEGEDLCNCEFSLAYGGKILLNNARLWLKRGHRYGLCGPNGCGKSTLMRAISNGQLEGFPSPDELKTVYVEHDLDSSCAEQPVVDFIASDSALKGFVSRDEVEHALASVGFTETMLTSPVAALSGGWKMKLALARAMLMKADILLLDEPTNHLDIVNVAWLVSYLNNLTEVSSIIVSHDSGFLDNVCTNIVHYENRKLRQYRGNLAKFVEQKPEARSYYELAASSLKFKFPEPGFLEGIKTKDRAILKMQKVNFTYPGAKKQALTDVTAFVTLSTRAAILGANGAGKSTMVKLLTGELEADGGTVWKHPNMRVAYVAQHAFHHIEQHLDKTPNEYIQWRYASGEDREELDKVSRKVSEEEEKAMAQKIVHDGQKKVVDCLLGRRKEKKSYVYEVQWVGLHQENNTWLPRSTLEGMGFIKLVNEIDAKEAAKQGLISRPLTTAAVQKHMEDFGLEAEFGSHSRIRGLSGGQKVKLVLAAAMWNNPHILVLDEPTNYLDREALGALAGAIKEYGGGVVMISHNQEFTSGLCAETWRVVDGRLTAEGDPSWLKSVKVEFKQADEMLDAFGNTIKITGPKKKLSRKELKARQKSRQMRRANGEVVSDSEDDL